MKRVLVTGATGFIGHHSLPRLLESGYEVHAVSGQRAPEARSRDIVWHRANILEPGEIASLVGKVQPTHLLHFAWYAVPGKYWTAPENLAWVRATANLMQIFSDHGGQRAVMAGSCAEYDWKFDYCSELFTPCRPATLYGACKHGTQVLLDAWSRQAGLSSAWGRIFFLYGPGEYPSRLVPSVINSLLRNEPALCTHGNQVRDFMHVEDVARAFVALLDSDARGAVNIASGVSASLKDVIHAIADHLNKRDLVRLGAVPAPAGEPGALIADVGRLRDEVGFRPRYELKQGIAQTVENMKSVERQ
ncbi:NAD-dependent epimerase/dehydratase family protein [Sulfuricaulis sp.]|jgi:nucleoside-diphosphate-sugar epimerase|uniref:NAD-dependent epimerase/dehydratase family protein n=1 Tax=Sulfuricaulis sp. TaxID=2003553 RepID=UPI0035599D4D